MDKDVWIALGLAVWGLIQTLTGLMIRDIKMEIRQNRRDIESNKLLTEAVRNEMYLKYPTKQDLKDVADDLKQDNRDMDQKLDAIIDKIGARRPRPTDHH